MKSLKHWVLEKLRNLNVIHSSNYKSTHFLFSLASSNWNCTGACVRAHLLVFIVHNVRLILFHYFFFTRILLSKWLLPSKILSSYFYEPGHYFHFLVARRPNEQRQKKLFVFICFFVFFLLIFINTIHIWILHTTQLICILRSFTTYAQRTSASTIIDIEHSTNTMRTTNLCLVFSQKSSSFLENNKNMMHRKINCSKLYFLYENRLQ